MNFTLCLSAPCHRGRAVCRNCLEESSVSCQRLHSWMWYFVQKYWIYINLMLNSCFKSHTPKLEHLVTWRRCLASKSSGQWGGWCSWCWPQSTCWKMWKLYQIIFYSPDIVYNCFPESKQKFRNFIFSNFTQEGCISGEGLTTFACGKLILRFWVIKFIIMSVLLFTPQSNIKDHTWAVLVYHTGSINKAISIIIP